MQPTHPRRYSTLVKPQYVSDHENVSGEVYFEVISKAQVVLVEYLKPDGGLSAEDAINEILGILDNEQLAELTAKHNLKKD